MILLEQATSGEDAKLLVAALPFVIDATGVWPVAPLLVAAVGKVARLQSIVSRTLDDISMNKECTQLNFLLEAKAAR